MGKSLVIVESPAKQRTINKILGPGYIVRATCGHIKDLPEKSLGVDIDNNFRPHYVILPNRRKIVAYLKKIAKESEKIYLATDPDREGEAIGWHIASELNHDSRNKIYRIWFNEITKDAILKAIKNPTEINKNKVDAQQARRILDRLVGYQISPLLWKSVKKGLSAGRVQSVAVRLVCEREEEIKKFVPEEYWTITVLLRTPDGQEFSAKLYKVDNKEPKISSKEEALKIANELKQMHFIVENVSTEIKEKTPYPPFITSTLQQEAAYRLGFSASKTMLVAQQLYEGLELGEKGRVGLITYMRTDSVRVADVALFSARKYIKEKFGTDFLPERPRRYKQTKGIIQAAHEAIRPTFVDQTPEEVKPFLNADQNKLYELIWRRFIASQMSNAVYKITNIDVKAGKYLFRATEEKMQFPGFTIIYAPWKDKKEQKSSESSLPAVSKGEKLILLNVDTEQHFTEPPPRYTEASLIKELEEKGIGRPSTYAPILKTIQERGYVKKVKNQLIPTNLGILVTKLLIENFPTILDVSFTAKMEDELDKIEEGKIDWVSVLKEFYQSFRGALDKALTKMYTLKKKVTKEISEELTSASGKKCPNCGSPLVIRFYKKSEFLACSAYPKCKFTESL